jgi:hypothetical protein
MPAIDISKAAMEAVKANNLKLDEEEAKETPEEPATEETPAEEEPAEETPEEEAEPEEEPTEEEEKPKGKPKMVPYSRLAETIKKMRTYERALQMMLEQPGRVAPEKEEVKEEKEEPLKVPTFETQEEALAWVVKTIGELTDKKIDKSIRKVVEPMTQKAAVERATKDIEALAAKDPKFFDYYDKMMEISGRNPGLSAAEVYTLAKGSASDKEKSKKILSDIKKKTELKKKAKSETRSSATDRVEVDATKFKNTREAALHVAKKMGLME